VTSAQRGASKAEAKTLGSRAREKVTSVESHGSHGMGIGRKMAFNDG